MTLSPIVRNFDDAAATYDSAAAAQAEIAEQLVTWAAETCGAPTDILDIGSGTGLLSEALHRLWPHATLTALDASPSMLRTAQRKLPALTAIAGDAAAIDIHQKFDAIFSSMALHWLPDPRQALLNWRSWLQPEGKLYLAFPIEGSFHEWRSLCRQNNVTDGLQHFPTAAFSADLAARTDIFDRATSYPSAEEFIRALKATGAATARSGSTPLSIPQLRKVLNASPRPMTATYRLAFLEVAAQPDP